MVALESEHAVKVGGDLLDDGGVLCNGHVISKVDQLRMIKFQDVVAEAEETGTYEGKSLEFGKGGRSRLFFDMLLLKGYSPEQALKVVRINAVKKVAAMRAGGM